MLVLSKEGAGVITRVCGEVESFLFYFVYFCVYVVCICVREDDVC